MKYVRVVVVALVLVVAVLADHGGARTAKSGMRLAEQTAAGREKQVTGQAGVDLLDTLRAELVEQVPRGSWVAIGTYPLELPAFDQRLCEIVIIERMRLVVSQAPQYRLDVVADPAAAVGYRLVTEAL